MINPVSSGSGGGEKVYAAGEVVSPDPDDSTDTTTDTTNMSVSLTMANPDQTLLQQNAKAGEMSYISSGFTVTTENVDGYNVYVQTAPGSTNKLTNGNITIDFVTTETPTSNFTDNTWGYAVDDTGTTAENLKYNPIPDTASIMNPAYTSSSTGETRNFTLNFATKFAKDATPGHYTSGVLLSVAAGAGEVVGLGFAGIEYMQEMDQVICYRAADGEKGRLEDIRDGKVYWVGKLKDGNCWMTQNLDLDIPANGLSKNDTDIPADWDNNSTYKPEATQITANPNFGNTNNNIKSWDPAQGGTDKYCADSKCNNLSTASSNNGHDAQGNYYSWGAATAGQAATLTSSADGEQSDQSICPKGWQLPLSRTTNNAVSKSFYHLLNQYGLTSKTPGIEINGAIYDISLSPLYFVYGGYVDTNSLLNAGSYGRYWSSTAVASRVAYTLNFTTGVSPSGNNSGRYGGNSVRCVAR